jgi:hypothetical protein
MILWRRAAGITTSAVTFFPRADRKASMVAFLSPDMLPSTYQCTGFSGDFSTRYSQMAFVAMVTMF